jgi:hypothetical protein
MIERLLADVDALVRAAGMLMLAKAWPWCNKPFIQVLEESRGSNWRIGELGRAVHALKEGGKRYAMWAMGHWSLRRICGVVSCPSRREDAIDQTVDSFAGWWLWIRPSGGSVQSAGLCLSQSAVVSVMSGDGGAKPAGPVP